MSYSNYKRFLEFAKKQWEQFKLDLNWRNWVQNLVYTFAGMALLMTLNARVYMAFFVDPKIGNPIIATAYQIDRLSLYKNEKNAEDIAKAGIEGMISHLRKLGDQHVDIVFKKTEKNRTSAKANNNLPFSENTPLAWHIDPRNNRGIIFLKNFEFDAPMRDFEKCAKKFRQCGVENIIIDVRNNPGGDTEQAAIFLGFFLGNKKPICFYTDKNGKRTRVVTSAEKIFNYKRLFCLVNGNTASAAEITANSLRYYAETPLIGEKTFGKETVQTKIDVGIGTLTLTSHKLEVVGEGYIGKRGLTPDFEIETWNVSPDWIIDLFLVTETENDKRL